MVFNKTKLRMTIILCVVSMIIGSISFSSKTFAKSEMPYYIKVNKQQNTVTVYERDKKGEYTIPVKSMVCSVGAATPLGVYKTPIKYRWKLLMGDVWGQYSTRIVGGILFHSVWYYKMDASTLSATQYNKLGTTASHGCVRLTVADAKWIYDNCPIGTTVEIYNDKNPGPLGKPEAVKLPVGTGWDPTDPSRDNPFNSKTPSITGVANKSIEWGTKTDLLKGVKAISTTGTDITKNIVVNGKVDPYKAGVYKIEYSVTDLLGRSIVKTMALTVKKSTQAPVLKGISDKVVSKDTVVDRAFAMKGVTAYLSTLKLSAKDIKVNIEKTTPDKYTLTYSIKASNKKIGKQTSFVYVDTAAPVITGIYFKELTKEQLEAGEAKIISLARKGLSINDDYAKLTTKDINVSVEQINDYAYQVTYTAQDGVGNTFSDSVQFAYFSDIRLEGVFNVYDVPYGTEINEAFVKRGVLAANKDNQDYTDKIKVDIQSVDNKHYLVTYSVESEDGSVVSLTCTFVIGDKPEGYVDKNMGSISDDSLEDNTLDNSELENGIE